MSHIHTQKGVKTKSLTGILRDATQHWEVPKPKTGLTSINKRNLWKYGGWSFTMLPRSWSLIVDRLRTRWRWTTIHHVEKGSKGLCMALPVATSLTPRTATPLRDHRSSTTRHVRYDNRPHPTRSSTTSPTVRIRQLHTYNNRQQHPVKLRHTCVRLILPKSVVIVSFHFTLYRHDIINSTIRYVTPCVLL